MIINNFGFIIIKKKHDEKTLSDIKKKCTLIPDKSFGIVTPVKVFMETTKYIILPVYFALKYFKDDLNYEVKFPPVEKRTMKSCITLKEHQIPVFDLCIKEKEKEFGGGIINIGTGAGKTVTALKIIEHYSIPTIIVVNKIELLEQWEREIKRFLPEACIGIIRGKKFIYEDCDIILSTVQTISIKSSITAHDFKWVGMCIIDESHNIASTVFSKIMFKIRPRYIFGLTATHKRKDKLEKIMEWYAGDIIYSDSDTEVKQQSQVKLYTYKGKSSIERYLYDGSPAVSSMLSSIANDNERNNLIVSILKKISEDPKRNILVISDRVSQLKYLHKNLNNSGLFIGSMKRDSLEKSKDKQILLGTYGLTNEGFNLPKLNCLMFATPRSNITQAIGRIYRKRHQISPLIVDIKDDFSIFKYQYYKRLKIYRASIDDVIITGEQFTEEPRNQELGDKCMIIDLD